MVEYDSAIPPGRTGKVTQEVNLHGMRGSFKKDIVVVSNADNEPSLWLYLKGAIRAVIDVEPQYIRLPVKQGQAAEATITLKTEKEDLAVTGISFQSSSSPSATHWNAEAPVSLKHSLKRSEGKNAEGQYDYTLTIRTDGFGKESKHGTFVIETNHKKKPSIEIRGMILHEQ